MHVMPEAAVGDLKKSWLLASGIIIAQDYVYVWIISTEMLADFSQRFDHEIDYEIIANPI